MNQYLMHIVVGAAFIYVLDARRNPRYRKAVEYFRENWRMLAFDFTVFILLGATFVCYFVAPVTAKEAFLAGAGWEAAAGALFSDAGSTTKKKDGSRKGATR